MPGTQATRNLGKDARFAALMVLGLGGSLGLLLSLTPHSREASALQQHPMKTEPVTLASTLSYLPNCVKTHYCVGLLGQRAKRMALLSYLE